jgi:hypothetical protein
MDLQVQSGPLRNDLPGRQIVAPEQGKGRFLKVGKQGVNKMKHSFRITAMALAVAVLAMLGCVAHAYGQTAYAYPFRPLV